MVLIVDSSRALLNFCQLHICMFHSSGNEVKTADCRNNIPRVTSRVTVTDFNSRSCVRVDMCTCAKATKRIRCKVRGDDQRRRRLLAHYVNELIGTPIYAGVCAHSRSYMYYAESIVDPKGFRAEDVFMGGPILDPQ